jgi:inhibitor of cysteine peptidase
MALITLTERDDQHSVRVSPGDEIVLRLPETPSTGFRWRVDRVEGTLEPAGDSFELGPNPQFGSGGIREFRFRVTGTAPGRIELRHRREWEGDASITKRYAVDMVPAS